MSTGQTLLLGAIAGITIFIGLPVGRIRNVPANVRSMPPRSPPGSSSSCSGTSSRTPSSRPRRRSRRAATAASSGCALLAAGFAVGLISLVYYDRWMKARRRKAFLLGPGAASPASSSRARVPLRRPLARKWLAVFIATGIGLHNFAEGLAIGQSAASDEISLAIVLVIGFALHNATEGFGIVAPLAGDNEMPSWGFLGLLGLIGGGPTFIGTAIGQAWVSEALSVVFLALAAGSILYVVIELLNVLRGAGSKAMVSWGILLGLILGFGTDFILVATGA